MNVGALRRVKIELLHLFSSSQSERLFSENVAVLDL